LLAISAHARNIARKFQISPVRPFVREDAPSSSSQRSRDRRHRRRRRADQTLVIANGNPRPSSADSTKPPANAKILDLAGRT